MTPSFGSVVLLNPNPDERESYRAALVAEGFDVIVCVDPLDALRVAVSRRPDAVVTRIVYPNSAMDGLELTRQLKADSRTAHIGVVMTLSLREAHRTADARDAGSDECLLLPSFARDVAEVVTRLLQRRPEWQQQSA